MIGIHKESHKLANKNALYLESSISSGLKKHIIHFFQASRSLLHDILTTITEDNSISKIFMIVEVISIDQITLLVRGASNASMMILILPTSFFKSLMLQTLIIIPCFFFNFLGKNSTEKWSDVDIFLSILHVNMFMGVPMLCSSFIRMGFMKFLADQICLGSTSKKSVC